MKTVKFVRNGQPLTDFETEEKVNLFILSDEEVWEIGNSLVLDYFRVKIKNKEINKDDYTFFVEDLSGELHPFEVDHNGRSSDWKDSTEIWSTLVLQLL